MRWLVAALLSLLVATVACAQTPLDRSAIDELSALQLQGQLLETRAALTICEAARRQGVPADWTYDSRLRAHVPPSTTTTTLPAGVPGE